MPLCNPIISMLCRKVFFLFY